MNKETIHLNMTAQEADSLAYVLMTALRKVTMLDREKTDVMTAANELFSQIGSRCRTDINGNHVEDAPIAKTTAAKPLTASDHYAKLVTIKANADKSAYLALLPVTMLRKIADQQGHDAAGGAAANISMIMGEFTSL